MGRRQAPPSVWVEVKLINVAESKFVLLAPFQVSHNYLI